MSRFSIVEITLICVSYFCTTSPRTCISCRVVSVLYGICMHLSMLAVDGIMPCHIPIILESFLNHSWYIVILLLNMLQLPRIHPQPQPSPACPQPGLRHCWLPARRVPRPNSSWWMGPCNTCGLADWSYNGYIKWYYDIFYVGYLGYLYTYVLLSYTYMYIYAYIVVIWCVYIYN